MKVNGSRTKVKHVLAVGGALALMLAACAPAATPTVAPVDTLAVTQPSVLPTLAATSAATQAVTAEATSAGTEMATSAATSAATAAATSMATGEATTAAANAPLLIESNKLVGLALMDSTGNSLGQIGDVLVDITGTVQAVVLNQAATGTPAATQDAVGTAAATSAATQMATSAATLAATEAATAAATAAATSAATAAVTPAATSAAMTGTPMAAGNAVIVPWADIMADPATQQLTYQGSAASLASMPAFDATMLGSGYVLRASGTSLPAQYDGLIRLGSQLDAVQLQTTANDQLGSLQNVILDLSTGKATYAAVDVSTFLGASNDVVLVPWSMFKLDTTDPASATSMTPVVRLNVTKTSLQNAPKFDETSLSFWPTPAQPTWDNQIKLFWQTSGL